jgi:hypothetical protein
MTVADHGPAPRRSRANVARFSPMAKLGAVFLLVVAGCANALRGGDAYDAAGAVSIVVDNQSAGRLLVYYAGLGSTGDRLGPVNPMQTRTFRLPVTADRQAQLEFYAVPSPPNSGGAFVTTPFQASGARQVRWSIRDGQRRSAVTIIR